MIDWDQVAQLRSEVGADEFDEVVEIFLEEVDVAIDNLRASQDKTTLQEDLHFLKGSALNLGFETFGQLCQEGERRAALDSAEAVTLDPILACYDASRRLFLEGIEQRKVA